MKKFPTFFAVGLNTPSISVGLNSLFKTLPSAPPPLFLSALMYKKPVGLKNFDLTHPTAFVQLFSTYYSK